MYEELHIFSNAFQTSTSFNSLIRHNKGTKQLAHTPISAKPKHKKGKISEGIQYRRKDR